MVSSINFVCPEDILWKVSRSYHVSQEIFFTDQKFYLSVSSGSVVVKTITTTNDLHQQSPQKFHHNSYGLIALPGFL